MMTSKWFFALKKLSSMLLCVIFYLFIYLFQKRGIEGCVVSNESIGVVAVSLWEPTRLHLSWPREIDIVGVACCGLVN